MKKTFVRILCLVAVLLIALMPLASANSYRYVKTNNGKKLNLRSNPWKTTGGDSNVIAQLPYRDLVLVYEYDANKTWAYIEDENPNGSGTVKGWVQTAFLSKTDPGPWKGNSSEPTQETITIDDINKAAKAIKVLDTPYETVIQTKKATNYVHLRWFPSTSAAYSAAYLCDTEIMVLAESKAWAQVRIIEDGRVGFIIKSCVAPVE